jgi:hypothetical protein
MARNGAGAQPGALNGAGKGKRGGRAGRSHPARPGQNPLAGAAGPTYTPARFSFFPFSGVFTPHLLAQGRAQGFRSGMTALPTRR